MGLPASQVRRRKKPKSPEALEYADVEGLGRLSKSGWLSREQMAVIEFCRRVGIKHGLGLSGPAAAQRTRRKRRIEASQTGWDVSSSPKVRFRVDVLAANVGECTGECTRKRVERLCKSSTMLFVTTANLLGRGYSRR